MARRKQTKTDKLRKLVQQQVRRMEKRGYIIDDETKAKIKSGKYQTLNSLRKNKYEKLYSQSRAVDTDTGGIFTGNQFRRIKRRASALKAAITRRFNRKDWDVIEAQLDKELDESIEKKLQSPEEIWEHQRRQQDILDKEQAQQVEAGEVIYKQVNDLIDAYPTPGSKFLDKALAKEIAKYGRDAVLQGMANAPGQVIAAAQDILYYEESADAIHTAFMRFFETIIGTKIDDYAEELGEVMDEMTDYEEV